jgi:hypothetical protein
VQKDVTEPEKRMSRYHHNSRIPDKITQNSIHSVDSIGSQVHSAEDAHRSYRTTGDECAVKSK